MRTFKSYLRVRADESCISRAETPKNDNNNDIVRTDVSDDETDVIDENETPHPR